MSNPTPKTGLIHYRRMAARALAVAAFALLCLSAYFFKAAPKPALLDEAFYILVVGGLTFWLAVFLSRTARKRSPSTTLEDTQPNPAPSYAKESGGEVSRPNTVLILIGLVTLYTLIEINGRFLGIEFLAQVSSHIQFVLFIVCLASLTLGFAGIRFPRRIFSPSLVRSLPVGRSGEGDQREGGRGSAQHFFSPITRNILLILIILLAFALRTIALGSAVHHLIDEIHFSTAVMSMRTPDTTIRLFTPFNTVTAFTWIYPYLEAWGVSLLGRNLDGLRLLSAIVGTLGIPALYLLARELFDRKTALLAALFLAVFPPHIQFSRIGLNNIADPLFGTLALAFLVRGLKYQRRADFAIAGAALGLTQYFYEGGRLLFPLLLFLSLAWFLLVKPRFFTQRDSQPSSGDLSFTRNSVPNTQPFFRYSLLLTFLVLSILIALPVYTTLIATKQPLDARFQTVGVGGSYWMRVEQLGRPQTLEEHLLIPFLVYVFQPEIALYYGGEQAMLLPYVVPFVMIGVLALLAYWRTPGIIILGWVLLASMGNMLLTESAIYARYVVVFPALALLAAVGLRTIAALVWPKKSRWRTGIVILVAVVLCVGQITYFFGPHLARYNDQLRQTFDSEDAIFRSAAFPFGTQIHIIEPTAPNQVYLSGLAGFLADGLTVFALPTSDLTAAYAQALSPSVDHAFFVEPYDDTSVILLAKYFKLEGPFDTPYNVPIYRELRLYYARATVAAG